MNKSCFQSSVVYQATVTRNDNNTSETYIGLTETDFKTRHRNHTASFRHAKHKNSTELSKHIWTLKNDSIDYSISWRVFLIIRNELVSSCQHRNKALLRNSWTLKFLSLPRIMQIFLVYKLCIDFLFYSVWYVEVERDMFICAIYVAIGEKTERLYFHLDP